MVMITAEISRSGTKAGLINRSMVTLFFFTLYWISAAKLPEQQATLLILTHKCPVPTRKPGLCMTWSTRGGSQLVELSPHCRTVHCQCFTVLEETTGHSVHTNVQQY